MRLSTVEFNGYKRLDRASCNVDGHTIALIGPNESGKSSVLQGLAWLTDDNRDDPTLSLREQNRRTRPDSDTLVVRARYRLDPDDLEALRNLNIDPSALIDAKTVTEFRLSRRKDGGHVTGLSTTVGRNHPFRHDSLIPKSAAICFKWTPGSRFLATRTTSSRNSLGYGFGTVHILPAAPLGTTSQLSPIRAAVPYQGGGAPARGPSHQHS